MHPPARPADDSAAILEARSLSLRYGEVQVLRSLNFTVRSGQLIGVLGPSGAGKSSLFKVLAGDLNAAAGRVMLAGEDVVGVPLWKRARMGVAYLPQEPSVLFDCSLEANLTTFSRLVRRYGKLEERDWLTEFDLQERASTRVSRLSGGERRRLELARTLMAKARLYILDEPFTGIDPGRVQRIGELLRREVQRGATVLLADHRVGEVLGLCDQAWLLVDGELRLQAAGSEFAEHPAVRSRYLQ